MVCKVTVFCLPPFFLRNRRCALDSSHNNYWLSNSVPFVRKGERAVPWTVCVVPIWVGHRGRVHIWNDWRRQSSPVDEIFRYYVVPVILAALMKNMVYTLVKKYWGYIINRFHIGHQTIIIGRHVANDMIYGHKRVLRTWLTSVRRGSRLRGPQKRNENGETQHLNQGTARNPVNTSLRVLEIYS